MDGVQGSSASALAEFERNLIRERAKAGLAVARARGRIGGRPKGLSPEDVTGGKSSVEFLVVNP